MSSTHLGLFCIYLYTIKGWNNVLFYIYLYVTTVAWNKNKMVAWHKNRKVNDWPPSCLLFFKKYRHHCDITQFLCKKLLGAEDHMPGLFIPVWLFKRYKASLWEQVCDHFCSGLMLTWLLDLRPSSRRRLTSEPMQIFVAASPPSGVRVYTGKFLATFFRISCCISARSSRS